MKGKKILLIEDDTDVAHAMAVRLRAKEFTVAMAPDAIAALAVARKEKPDLIILDLGLPGGDGFAAMQRLKANVDLMLIAVIVVSACDPLFDEPRAIEAGAGAFLQKPVDNEDFLSAVDNALLRRAHAQR